MVGEILTIVQQDDACMSERISSFLNEFADNVIRVAEQEDLRIASDLVYFIYNISFKINVIKRYIKILS